MGPEWKFRRRQGQCHGCERAFAEEERHASLLFVSGDELAREDRCAACWTARDRSVLFFWFTRHRSDRRKLRLDLATLEQLFVQLGSRQEPKLCEMRYVLCLLLMRKRRLKLERIERRAGTEAMVVRRPRQSECSEVSVFDFTPERMAELRRDLLALFEGAESWDTEPAPTQVAAVDEVSGEAVAGDALTGAVSEHA